MKFLKSVCWQGAILLFDLTKRSSFKNLETWLEQVKEVSMKQFDTSKSYNIYLPQSTFQFAPSNAVIVVVGNKSDLDQNREVTSHEIMLVSISKISIIYFWSSAIPLTY